MTMGVNGNSSGGSSGDDDDNVKSHQCVNSIWSMPYSIHFTDFITIRMAA